ncbi:MAG TPA: hypothetical protein VFY29_14835 [Terriglobia bacterium]|nr:hypothetical protein [Terriglobia bacterium]
MAPVQDDFQPKSRAGVIWGAVGFCVTVALSYVFALINIRNTFGVYDDEGFLLITLKQHMGGAALYRDMYTDFGPFYYIVYEAVFRLCGWMVTHDHIRWLTIMNWVLVALGWAVCVWIWNRSVWWAAATVAAATVTLRGLSQEPGHPQGEILLLLLGVFLALCVYERFPRSYMFAVVGAASAGLTLTKINLGLFTGAAFVMVWLASVPQSGRWRRLAMVMHGVCALVPVLLMRSQLTSPVVAAQCVALTFGIWATVDALRRRAAPELGGDAAAWGAAGFLGVGGAIVWLSARHGVSLSWLVEGVALQPLRLSQGIPYQALNARIALTVCAVLVGAGLLVYCRRNSSDDERLRLQAIVALLVIAATVYSPSRGAAVAPGFMWLFVPGQWGRTSGPSPLARLTVVTVAPLALLMVYPVDGAQVFIAASLILLAAFAGLLDALGRTHLALPGARIAFGSRAACALVLLVALAASARTLSGKVIEKADGRMPGSQLVGLSPERYAAFEEITREVRARCDTLVTFPGMSSFQIWTELPHPNGQIWSSSMVFNDGQAQVRLRSDFMRSSRPCVIFNPDLEEWADKFRIEKRDQPFLNFLRTDLTPVYGRYGYEIRVPPDQADAWR